MKLKELKEKNEKELNLVLSKLIKEYNDIKFKKVTGVIENPLSLRTIRKDIARINTLLRENEIKKIKEEIEKME
jgi:large subunit ribosomal protein L29